MADPAETTQASGAPAADDLLQAVRALSDQVGSLRRELQDLRGEQGPLPAAGGHPPGWGERGPAGPDLAWLGALETPRPRRPEIARLPLEVLFLAAVALAAALADLEPLAVVAVMAGAWALVALAEWLGTRAERRLEDAEAGLGALPLAGEDPSWFGPPLERTAPAADALGADAPRLPPPGA